MENVRVTNSIYGRMDKFPMQNEYEHAVEGDSDLDKTIIKLGELNE